MSLGLSATASTKIKRNRRWLKLGGSNKRVDGVVRAPAGPATRRSHTSLMDLACALLLLLLLLLLCTCADAMTPLFGVHAVR